MPLDEISKGIIRKFQWPMGESSRYIHRPSVYRMALEFKVHPKVIKSRIKSLLDTGVIRGVKLYADSKFMPWNRYFILCKATAGLSQEIYSYFQELPFVERVVFGTLKLPNPTDTGADSTVDTEFLSISVIASNEPDMKSKTGLLEETLGFPLDIMEVINDFQDKVKIVNAVEYSILNIILYQNPMSMSIADIAQKLSIPGRTVRRKIEKMLDDGVIYEEVSLDTSMAHGILLPSIIMVGDYREWLLPICESKFLRERLLLYKNWSRFSFFVFYADTFSTIDQIVAGAKAINPASILSYRNGSYNNPTVEYPQPGTEK